MCGLREFVNHRCSLGATILAIAICAPASQGQTTAVVSTTKTTLLAVKIKGPETRPVAPDPLRKREGIKAGELPPVRFHKNQFIVLSAGVYAASFADMHQTLHVRHYSWWTETDPLARPLAKLPAPAYYAAGFALATGVNWLSWKMGHSRRWHKLAVIPQLLTIAGNTYGYRSNCYRNY